MTRLSNHPDFVGVTLVLIEKLNPEVFLYDCRNTYVLKITNHLSSTGADEQELATPILSLCHGIFIY